MRLHAKGPIKISTQESGLIEVAGRGALCSTSLLAAVELAWTVRSRRDPMDYMAMLVDLQGAYVTVPEERQTIWPTAPAVWSIAKELPVAMVVDAEHLPVARRYCMATALTGCVLGAFEDREQAMPWLLARARAIRAQHRTTRLETPQHRHAYVRQDR